MNFKLRCLVQMGPDLLHIFGFYIYVFDCLDTAINIQYHII